MTRVREFQLYLLSKMSNSALVSGAIRTLGSTESEMRGVADQLGRVEKLDDAHKPADVYTQLLGAPAATRVLGTMDTSGSFVGSTRRTYLLPLWPHAEFVVNEHRDGYAWGEQFESRGDRRLPTDISSIQAWEWTRDQLVPAAANREIVDEWTDFLDIKLGYSTAVGLATFRARFDLGLLQSFDPVSSGS